MAVSVVGVPPKEGREVAAHVHDEEDEQEQRGAVQRAGVRRREDRREDGDRHDPHQREEDAGVVGDGRALPAAGGAPVQLLQRRLQRRHLRDDLQRSDIV